MKIYREQYSRFIRLEDNFNIVSNGMETTLEAILAGEATITFTDDNGNDLPNSAAILRVIVNYYIAKKEFQQFFPIG